MPSDVSADAPLPAPDRLSAALADLAERDHIHAVRKALVLDLREAEREVLARAASRSKERADVERYQRGAWALLYAVVADREGRIAREEREAAIAEARYAEAAALRDRLRREVAELDARARLLERVEGEVAAARAAREEALLDAGGAGAEALHRLDQAAGILAGERRAIDEALAAGHIARHELAQVIEILSSAGAWSTADLLTDSLLISGLKRAKLDDAQTSAGHAQAALTVFRGELSDLGLDLAGEVGELAHHHRFLDVWLDNLISDWSVGRRIDRALDTAKAVQVAVMRTVSRLDTRRASLAAQAETIARERRAIVEA